MAAASRREPRVAAGQRLTWRQRERILIRLGYRALAIGYNKAHLGQHWIRHFAAKSDRLFVLALREWRHAQEM